MASGTDLLGARLGAVAGLVALAVTGMNPLLLPAAIIGLLAGVAGLRHVGSDLERASMRFGVALLVSGIVLLLGLTGGPVLVALGGAATAGFLVAWRTCERVRADRQRTWGVHQRDVLARDRELSRRRDALRDAPPDR